MIINNNKTKKKTVTRKKLMGSSLKICFTSYKDAKEKCK